MPTHKKTFIASGVFLFAAAVAGLGFLFLNDPRVLTINDSATPNGATSTAVTASDTGKPQSLLDVAAYNAKLLATANLPAPQVITSLTTVKTASGTIKVSTTTVRYALSADRVPLKDLWPATKAALPDGGALLPFSRIVAYYGNLYSKQMGVLGEYPAPQMLAMLASTTAAWQAADPSTPVIPALDYIAVAAQAAAGPDGMYRLRMPPSQIDEILQLAHQANGIVFLDVQLGLSNVQTEIPLLVQYLKLPQVNLALDPEFAMHNGQRPGTVIGSLDASDVNWAAQYLANIVKENNLPPKVLVVHRFTEPMVTNAQNIIPLPQVQIVMDMDGFGPPSEKMTTYRDFIQNEPVQFTGFKLFYKNDTLQPGSYLMTPTDILKLTPQPSFIQYQ